MDVRFGGLLSYALGDGAHGQLRRVAGFEGAALIHVTSGQ
jgi:hypothetical protein